MLELLRTIFGIQSSKEPKNCITPLESIDELKASLDPVMLEKGWIRPADFMPVYLSIANEHLSEAHKSNSVFFMSSDLGTRIVNGEVSCYYPDIETLRPELAYIYVQDMLGLVEDSAGATAGIISYLRERQGNPRQGSIESHKNDISRCALTALKQISDKITLQASLEDSKLKRHITRSKDPLPPYSLSTEGDVGFYMVLRKGVNVPIHRVGRSPDPT